MLIKKYTVKTISEAMEKIREEFGEDAYILDTRKVKKGGFFGIGGEKYLEVTVLSDNKKQDHKKDVQKSALKTENFNTYTLKDLISKNSTKDSNRNDQFASFSNLTKETTRPTKIESNAEFLKLVEENRKLSSQMDKDADAFYNKKSSYDIDQITDSKIGITDSIKLNELKKAVDKLNKKLEISNIYLQELKEELYKNSYSKDFIDSLISEIEDLPINENWRKDENLKVKFERKISECIKLANFKEMKGKIVFTGPTGVGKTTTLAKNAAKFVRERSKIAFVTIDTYRIAATDQLKIYADILGVPLFICYTPQDLKITVESLLNYDTVLIDTAGRSHKNNLQMGELKIFIDSIKPDYKIMLVSANSNPQEMINIFDSFSIIQLNCLIFTKIDEVTTFGQLFSFLEYSNLPLIGITDGQRVPEDLKFPDKEWFVSKAMREVFE